MYNGFNTNFFYRFLEQYSLKLYLSTILLVISFKEGKNWDILSTIFILEHRGKFEQKVNPGNLISEYVTFPQIYDM